MVVNPKLKTPSDFPLKRGRTIAIVGPTASGKTGIGVRLAKEFDGEIVSADSRQVFRRLNIGTGKDLKEYGDIPYHMIDIIDPGEKMTLFDYLPLARKAIDDILSRGKLPIIVGGTGLYVQGLVEGFELESRIMNHESPTPPSLPSGRGGIRTREQLDNLTTGQLNEILEKIDPEKYETVDQKNRHRLIRAIELAQEGLRPTKVKPDFEVLQIGVDLPRKELFERIDRRVDDRFENGMLEEVVDLLKSGVNADWLMGLGLEYRDITEFLNPKSEIRNPKQISKSKIQISKLKKSVEFAEMNQQLKFHIHQFARRQLTWLRRFPEINWLSDYKEMERFVKIFVEH